MNKSNAVVGLYRVPFTNGPLTRVQFRHGQSLLDMARHEKLPLGFADMMRATICVGGEPIAKEFWRCVRPKAGQSVTFHLSLAGGAQGEQSGAQKFLMAVVLAAATIFTGGAAAGAFGSAGGLIGQLLGVGVSATGSSIAEAIDQ